MLRVSISEAKELAKTQDELILWRPDASLPEEEQYAIVGDLQDFTYPPLPPFIPIRPIESEKRLARRKQLFPPDSPYRVGIPSKPEFASPERSTRGAS